MDSDEFGAGGCLPAAHKKVERSTFRDIGFGSGSFDFAYMHVFACGMPAYLRTRFVSASPGSFKNYFILSLLLLHWRLGCTNVETRWAKRQAPDCFNMISTKH